MALMKSGWLWRQSSILRRWKRNWFVLWLDGGLVYYQDETQRDLEGRIHIKFNCRDIKTGRECRDVQPPEGKSRDCLLTIVLRDGSKVTLCAESEDDAVAWKMAVLEAKTTPVHMYDPYDDYYQTVPLDSHQTMYVSSGYYGTQYGGMCLPIPASPPAHTDCGGLPMRRGFSNRPGSKGLHPACRKRSRFRHPCYLLGRCSDSSVSRAGPIYTPASQATVSFLLIY
ncbi:pleckstrin homology domain-containing family B member 1 isoform 2-T2 [Macrochelys suwanniensis]